MDPRMIPDAHPKPRLNVMWDYVADTVRALAEGGVRVERSWLDPEPLRDATILYCDADGALRGLVWDEETGWRTGEYVSGEQGVRTELSDVAYLGGGVLVRPDEASERLTSGVRVPKTTYRSMWDLRDGLDDALRTY